MESGSSSSSPARGKALDTDLVRSLSEVIEGLARLQVFISQTDHLNDRKLYAVTRADRRLQPAAAGGIMSRRG